MKKIAAALITLMSFLGLQGDAQDSAGIVLRYGDGIADGRKSLGGSGEMIAFALPSQDHKVAGLRIHGSRYGVAKAPDEDFLVFFLTEDRTKIAHTELAPYSLFNRGEDKWVEIRFEEPIALPESFWVSLDFRAHRTKGVYVSFDSSTTGEHSKTGLPGRSPKDVDFDGDWMVEIILAEE